VFRIRKRNISFTLSRRIARRRAFDERQAAKRASSSSSSSINVELDDETSTYDGDDHATTTDEHVGIAAVKYFDLSHERTRNYRFDYAQMLALRGNTAVYLLYATARISALLRRASSNSPNSSSSSIDDVRADLLHRGQALHVTERALLMHLIQVCVCTL
jgi:arginyl-tRNA synthetase